MIGQRTNENRRSTRVLFGFGIVAFLLLALSASLILRWASAPTMPLPVLQQAVMAVAAGRTEAVMLHGLPLRDLRHGGTLARSLRSGSLERVTPTAGGIAIGVRLATALGVTTGGTIDLISPSGTRTPFGTAPRICRYRVVAIFASGDAKRDRLVIAGVTRDRTDLLADCRPPG